jgi:hypothetical protein
MQQAVRHGKHRGHLSKNTQQAVFSLAFAAKIIICPLRNHFCIVSSVNLLLQWHPH